MVFLKTIFIVLFVLLSTACMKSIEDDSIIRDTSDESRNDFDYGVFLSLTGREAVEAAENYKMVVIDAQNLSENEVAEMQNRGQLVYSYLNIGSLETFRTYFEEFEHLTLKPYINWDNEFWVDASTDEWQEFVSVELANDYLEKGLDGFWVDNADVYYQFPTEEMYEGVEQIMLTLMEYEKPVVINGGDQFVQRYLERNSQIDDILTGVNQETVFSSINFVDRTLGVQNDMTREYYLNYLNLVEQEDKEIYLLEYTNENDLRKEIAGFTEERGWVYYISDSIELDGD